MIHPQIEENKVDDVLITAVLSLFKDLGIKVPTKSEDDIVVEHEFVTNMQLFDVVLALTDYCFLIRNELSELKEIISKHDSTNLSSETPS